MQLIITLFILVGTVSSGSLVTSKCDVKSRSLFLSLHTQASSTGNNTSRYIGVLLKHYIRN